MQFRKKDINSDLEATISPYPSENMGTTVNQETTRDDVGQSDTYHPGENRNVSVYGPGPSRDVKKYRNGSSSYDGGSYRKE